MADGKRIRVGAPHEFSSNGSFLNTFAMNGTTDQLEFIFEAQAAITITRLGFRPGSITGASPVYRASLQGVTTSGNPDGTIKGGGSPASKTFTPTANTWAWITLDNSYTCTRGERLAAVIDYSSGTINGSNFSNFVTTPTNSPIRWNFPFVTTNDAGSRTKSNSSPPLFGYGSAGTAYGFPLSGNVSTTLNTGTTPDEWGIKFTLPSGWGDTFKVLGARFAFGTSAGGTAIMKLYDSDGSTVLQDVTIRRDESSAGSGNPWDFIFNEATLSSLNFGTAYRLTILPQEAGTSWFGAGFTVGAAADMDAYEFGSDFMLTSRTDAGAWTDTNTTRPFMELILDDWTEPAGGGGGLILPRSMNGGLV